MLSADDFCDLVAPAAVSPGRSRRGAWPFWRRPLRDAQVESEVDSVRAISTSNAVALAGWMGSAPWLRLRERSTPPKRSMEVGAACTSLEPEDGLTQTPSEDNLVDLLCSGPTHRQRNSHDLLSAAGSNTGNVVAGKVPVLRRSCSIHSDLPDFGMPASPADLLSVVGACRHADDDDPPVSLPSTPSASLSEQMDELAHDDQADECGDSQTIPGYCSRCRCPLIKGSWVHFALDRAFCSPGCRHQHLDCLHRLEQRDCGHSVATWQQVETNRRVSQKSEWPVHYRGP